MNRKAYLSILSIIFIAALAACGGGSKTTPPVEIITVTSGSGQSTVVSTAFTNPLVATVSTGGVPNAGVAVTFTAPGSGASGTFNSGSATAMVTTDANGVATSPAFTANSTAGGPYIVTAAAAGVTANVNFTLTNTATVVASSQFSFYVTGQEPVFFDFYALAGSVTIDENGDVLGGEQDFNDADGFTFSADAITGGSLVEDSATGQGTLTLITNDTSVGVNGTETLSVEFVNPSHALLIEFDATETSSGSLDLQTLPSTLNGSFAFTVTGVGTDYEAFDVGGVFTVNGTNLTSGVYDSNDSEGGAFLGTGFTGTISVPDSFGRGTITNTNLATTINYYIIGPEAIRLIDMDESDSAIGSAFGQGDAAGGFNNASLQASVFGFESNNDAFLYAAAGQFTTTATAMKPAVHKEGIGVTNEFSGVADADEEGDVAGGSGGTTGVAISGIYSINTNGYGGMTIDAGELLDISSLGIYMVDPNININDPNNSTGTGGALVADLDLGLNGTGVLIPQTDPASSSFTGAYAFGAQVFNGGSETGDEVDFVGQGTVSEGLLTGAGFLNDPGITLIESDNGEYDDVTYSGTAFGDSSNQGRYTILAANDDPFEVGIDDSFIDYSAVAYQASGGQLLWVEIDEFSLFGGSIQQQNLPTPTVAKKAAAKAKTKLKK